LFIVHCSAPEAPEAPLLPLPLVLVGFPLPITKRTVLHPREKPLYFKSLSVEKLLVQTKISGISVAVIVEKLITLIVVNNRVLVNIEKLIENF
jgi:hypothetical protein